MALAGRLFQAFDILDPNVAASVADKAFSLQATRNLGDTCAPDSNHCREVFLGE
jgi:hypothetical protein